MLEIEKTIKGRFGKEIKPEGNVLRIGASTVPAQYILPNVMSTFHAECPGEKLKLFETCLLYTSYWSDRAHAGIAT